MHAIRGIYLVTALPARAGKRHAAEYVADKLAEHFRPDRVIWAGDSDNDLPMLLARSMCGVVVGNSYSSRLRHAARETENVYQAKTSNALGVREGIEHFFESSLA